MNTYYLLVSRILLSQLFLIAGIGKISGYAATQGYMQAFGVPGMLLPLVILLEVGGGLALLVGWQTRWISWALAIFSVVAAAIFHHNFSQQMDMINFMKDFAIAGGLMALAVHGPGAWSFDRRPA
ncbi:MAG: DoxX family protein [Gammaproteobacteria bacterium]|jgi:putative oxidoreductase